MVLFYVFKLIDILSAVKKEYSKKKSINLNYIKGY